jgi:ABC-type oligopeptide transport system ATPase subunit/NAD(P)-dependent dehydrogenase (short-subunit alcohol dehydrogenase family)
MTARAPDGSLMLEVRGLGLALPDRAAKRPFRPAPSVDILRGIDLDLGKGESLAVVGESGSGKTSLGRTLLRLLRPSRGSIRFDGRDITFLDEADLRPLRARLQMIFQDPLSALNPRRRIADSIAQPLIAFGRVADAKAGRHRAAALLERVGLPAGLGTRYPHELSGGQRQRVGIARAIALEPALVVADEIVSGLDASSQAQILTLLRALKSDLDLSLIFISHDLSVVRVLCDRVLVLARGSVVETGSCAEIFAAPRQPYTRALLDAVPLPIVDPGWIERSNADEVDPQRDRGGRGMKIVGSIALVTGANRGIGRAYVAALLAGGAKKIYATARHVDAIADLATANPGKVEILALDITDPKAVAVAAAQCKDVTLLINNAGINRVSALMAAPDLQAARAEMETNYFGTLAMCRAFAPVLKGNGGGAIINMLSILGRVNLPLMGSLCASKAAGLSLTQGVRAELAKQGTAVIAVMPGAVDTDMSRDFPPPKMPPRDVADAALAALEAGHEDVYPGDMAHGVSQGLAADPKAVEKQFAAYLPG